MVLESLITPLKAERHPVEMFFIGLLFASVSMFLGLWIFKDQVSLVMVFLTVMVSMPLIYLTMKYEEKRDTEIASESLLLKQHSRALSFFMFLFFGFVIAYAIWYILLPDGLISSVFSTQLETIRAINSKVLGVSTGSITASQAFYQIFSNNIKVLLFCIFFSFFFGAGAIFILTWNASVIAAAVGTFFKNNIVSHSALTGISKIPGYFHVFSLSILRYFIHGVPEILGYFTAGLAGGIISVAVIRHDFGTQTFRRVLYDSLDLLLLSLFFIFVAALLEVFVTPLFF